MARTKTLPERATHCQDLQKQLAPFLARWAQERGLVWSDEAHWADDAAQSDDGAILALLATPDQEHALTVSLCGAFEHVTSFQARAIEGLLLRPGRLAAAEFVRVPSDPASEARLMLASQWELPALPAGLIGQPRQPLRPPARVAAEEPRLEALAERLWAMEDKLTGALFQVANLERQLEQQTTAAQSLRTGGYFDVPNERHPWPLAENPLLKPDKLGLYDRRRDDDVVWAAAQGRGFFERFGLAGEDPDFTATTAHLAAYAREQPESPDASVVIPIYGQLAYTLNCLDSLFQHQSRFSFEIILVDDCGPDRSGEFLPQIPGIRYHKRAANGGFIAACNEGGTLARGRHIVLLNNDTRVVDGWLDGLIGTFATFPDAGLVGSKLLYDDCSLQEAGGIIWRDGSCWNYGRGDDPNRPQYCYARQADYISGASIALPIELWRELAGFDPYYTPAYCEDADLCLRIVARGLQVWYQPSSRVVHYEGKTSGTDTSVGVKSYQIVNTKKLYLRWRDRLLDHQPNGTAPYFERERKIKRRMLVVDAVAPTPKQDAGSVQTVLGLQTARDLGYKVHFVPEDNWLFEPGSIPDLQATGADCAYAPYEVGFENYLRRYGFLFDVILVYRVQVIERTIELILKHAPQATLLYHVADLHHLRMAREAALTQNETLAQQAMQVRKLEFSLIGRAHGTITHSQYEADLIKAEMPDANVTVWPLMFEFFGTSEGFSRRRDICFLGGYRHPPNIDAVQYFVDEVWPLVRAKLKGARFIIAGANPTPEVEELADKDVVVTGIIDDLADLFDAAKVFVAPLRIGAGVKGKVMTALSYGIPVVSTAIGIEGTSLVPDEHVLLGDTPQELADHIIKLYRDEALWQRLSEAGQQIMRDHLSPRHGVKVLADAIDRATHRRLGVAMP